MWYAAHMFKRKPIKLFNDRTGETILVYPNRKSLRRHIEDGLEWVAGIGSCALLLGGVCALLIWLGRS